MNEHKRGKIIVIDAIDGAGKSTAIKGIARWLEERGIAPAFDLIAFQEAENRLPEIKELGDAKLLIAAEPTHSWIGRAIREELIAKHENRAYSGRAAAEAFALDRLILYRRVIIPFLEKRPDGFVIQDRGLISSLAYQPLQDPTLAIDELMMLEGNRLELEYAPDLMLLLTLDVATAQSRLAGRIEKRDASAFEAEDFQKRLAGRYTLPEVRRPFIEQGTRIAEIDASKNEQVTLEQIIPHLSDLL